MQAASHYNQKILFRLTALWAFVESGLGGMMHAMHIPFTGLVLNGISVIVISLLYHYSNNNARRVFQSLFFVIVIKLALSPHTSPTAYIAIGFQACFSVIIYKLLGIHFISSTLVFIITFLESAFQKLFTLTLFYGFELWDALRKTVDKILFKLFNDKIIDQSLWIVVLSYGLIYIIGAIFFSFVFYRIFNNIINNNYRNVGISQQTEMKSNLSESKKRSYLKIFYFAFIGILLSYILYAFNLKSFNELFLYLIRTIVIIGVWFLIIIPFFHFMMKKWFIKADDPRIREMEELILLFPFIKQSIQESWSIAIAKPWHKRIPVFIEEVFIKTLFVK